MQDAITCPDCGVNADTCRCALRWPHTSALLCEAVQPFDTAVLSLGRAWQRLGIRRRRIAEQQPIYQQLVAGLRWEELWDAMAPMPRAAFTTDAAGRLTLRTP